MRQGLHRSSGLLHVLLVRHDMHSTLVLGQTQAFPQFVCDMAMIPCLADQ